MIKILLQQWRISIRVKAAVTAPRKAVIGSGKANALWEIVYSIPGNKLPNRLLCNTGSMDVKDALQFFQMTAYYSVN